MQCCKGILSITKLNYCPIWKSVKGLFIYRLGLRPTKLLCFAYYKRLLWASREGLSVSFPSDQLWAATGFMGGGRAHCWLQLGMSADFLGQRRKAKTKIAVIIIRY